MTGTARFICSDPDAGDFEFADVEAVLDALEAALVQAATPLFDAARQSWQPVGLHPEIRAAWEQRLRYRPPVGAELTLPELPSVTTLVRSLPEEQSERERRREAFARLRTPGASASPTLPRDGHTPRFAALGMLWVLVLLGLVGWIILTFAARLTEFAANMVDMTQRR
jgi:hypothetical protein